MLRPSPGPGSPRRFPPAAIIASGAGIVSHNTPGPSGAARRTLTKAVPHRSFWKAGARGAGTAPARTAEPAHVSCVK